MVDIDMMMKRYRNRGRHKQTNKQNYPIVNV